MDKDKKRLAGVTFFAIVYIVTSLMSLFSLYNLAYESDTYRAMLPGYYSDTFIYIRFVFSWLSRILGLIVAVGLLQYNNLCRKIAIFLCGFSICVMYWKHPYASFEHAVINYQKNNVLFDQLGLSVSTVAWAAVISLWVIEILFCLFYIYYFTRPKVKVYFQ